MGFNFHSEIFLMIWSVTRMKIFLRVRRWRIKRFGFYRFSHQFSFLWLYQFFSFSLKNSVLDCYFPFLIIILFEAISLFFIPFPSLMSVVKHWYTSFPFFLKALWDKALELRLLVQKAFSSANRLPQVFFGIVLLFNLILAL